MLNFQEPTLQVFLSDYWQKKPLLIRNALPHFQNLVSPEELAGLAMEQELESRIVLQDPKKSPEWSLRRGPFSEKDFKCLPASHWTLLVQGVDRFLPEIAALLDDFDFIPQWRIDDIMISYAVDQGSVGPHFDHYDVFLYQAKGRRQWKLTTSNCNEANYLADLELRIMKEFKLEQEYILEEGDMLYLPAKIGHYGISLSPDCMTYSIGYRSYQDQELWDNFADYLSAQNRTPAYYQDPSWSDLKASSELPEAAWRQAKSSLEALLADEARCKDWFAGFATALDAQADSELAIAAEQESSLSCSEFQEQLQDSLGLSRHPCCRFAYYPSTEQTAIALYLNGAKYQVDHVTEALVQLVANRRSLPIQDLLPFLAKSEDRAFLYGLWKQGFCDFIQ